jgi:hypothetical protein
MKVKRKTLFRKEHTKRQRTTKRREKQAKNVIFLWNPEMAQDTKQGGC